MHGSCYMLKMGIIAPRGMTNDRVGPFASVDGSMNIKRDLRPSPNQTHAKGTSEDQKAGNDPFLSPKNPPALIAEKIFRHQLY